MKRVFVVLLAVFMMVGVISSVFAAESDLSPLSGLIFSDPNPYGGFSVGDRNHIISELVGNIRWTINFGSSIFGLIEIWHVEAPLSEGFYDDPFTFDASDYRIVEKGPIETLAGLPAFYIVAEVGSGSNIARVTSWYISCEDRYFAVQSATTHRNDPEMVTYNIIFADFLNNLKATNDLKPGNIGSGGGTPGNGGNGGDDSSGGCDVSGGLFSILSLAVFFVLRRNKI